MTTYVVKIEGRKDIPVPEDIAKDQDKLRRALSTVINGITDAEIQYNAEKNGVVEIEVIKRAGVKGQDDDSMQDSRSLILNALMQTEGGRNPAIEMYLELQSISREHWDPAHLLELGTQIDQAIASGEEQAKQMKHSLELLIHSTPAKSSCIVQGF